MPTTQPVLINPNLVFARHDPFTTGIVFMPVSLAYFAAALRHAGFPPTIIDCFAESPAATWETERFYMRGIHPTEAATRIPAGAPYAVVYAINMTAHVSVVELCQAIRRRHPALPIVVQENTQAVTAYSLRRVAGQLYAAGADYILTGEAEQRGLELHQALIRGGSKAEATRINGIGTVIEGHEVYTPPKGFVPNLDDLAFPAWDLFPLRSYWDLKHAHGPQEGRYLPLLTSRGCPYPCRFCVVPETNSSRWRSRSAANVVDEMEHWVRTIGVREFHIEDLNPTVQDQRTRQICEEILRRDMVVTWKIAAGTKVETIKNKDTIALMARAGCRYISISPESGSPRLLKQMDKSFRVDHALELVRAMNEHGIRSQACFILGFPGENDEDREMSWRLVHELSRAGLDEIALFVVTPVPGSAIFADFQGYPTYSDLNFSPSWRADYAQLNDFRVKLYRAFLWWKLIYHPAKILAQPWRFLRRRYATKMEMAPVRALDAVLSMKRAKPYGGTVIEVRQ